MSRGDLSEAEWRLLKDLLPAERGRKSRPAHDNRTIVNGILWRIRTGAPWRDVPEKYGKWMTVWQHLRRWSHPRAATLMHGMRRHKKKYGIITMCIGTGMGAAGIFEAL